MVVRYRVFTMDNCHSTRDLYGAVAAFASTLGDRLVSISGFPSWGNSLSAWAGEVVVWYREES